MANQSDTQYEDEESTKQNDEYWEKEKQIKFFIATSDDTKEMIEFIQKEFMPEEPCFKNWGIITDGSGGWLHRKFTEMMDQFLVIEPVTKVLHTPACIIARSTITNNIVGVRIGEIVSRDDTLKKEPTFSWIAKLPTFLKLPHIMTWASNIGTFFENLPYGKQYMFDELEEGKVIYYCMILSVGSEARGKGLGTEMIKRGYSLAKKAGCDYTYSAASSSFTQRTFKKLGNEKVLHEVRYEDHRYDSKGRPLFLDTGVHESIQITVIDHREKQSS